MSAVRQGKKGQQAGDLRVHERRGQDTGRVREFDDWSELQVENGLYSVHRLPQSKAALSAISAGKTKGECSDCGSRPEDEEL